MIKALRKESDVSWVAAEKAIKNLTHRGLSTELERHWIVNGFTCTISRQHVEELGKIPGADYETGHGPITCHAALKEVLRRKALNGN